MTKQIKKLLYRPFQKSMGVKMAKDTNNIASSDVF